MRKDLLTNTSIVGLYSFSYTTLEKSTTTTRGGGLLGAGKTRGKQEERLTF